MTVQGFVAAFIAGVAVCLVVASVAWSSREDEWKFKWQAADAFLRIERDHYQRTVNMMVEWRRHYENELHTCRQGEDKI